ncbi:MAG: hypothetical protein RLZZ502_1697 [Pseudomonadota bacterium]|jgi:two-component system response regulator QseB
MRVLIVEDDAVLARGLQIAFNQRSIAWDQVGSVAQAKSLLETEEFDLILLDLTLPDGSGLQLLKWLRRDKQSQQSLKNIPVLVLTARQNFDDKITGLSEGADDYMTKPFMIEELVVRMQVISRRANGRTVSASTFAGVELDYVSRRVSYHGQPINLSAKEYSVLAALMENPGAVFSRAKLEDAVYSYGSEVESNAIEVYVFNLRKKMSSDLIRTIRGAGYCLSA